LADHGVAEAGDEPVGSQGRDGEAGSEGQVGGFDGIGFALARPSSHKLAARDQQREVRHHLGDGGAAAIVDAGGLAVEDDAVGAAAGGAGGGAGALDQQEVEAFVWGERGGEVAGRKVRRRVVPIGNEAVRAVGSHEDARPRGASADLADQPGFDAELAEVGLEDGGAVVVSAVADEHAGAAEGRQQAQAVADGTAAADELGVAEFGPIGDGAGLAIGSVDPIDGTETQSEDAHNRLRVERRIVAGADAD